MAKARVAVGTAGYGRNVGSLQSVGGRPAKYGLAGSTRSPRAGVPKKVQKAATAQATRKGATRAKFTAKGAGMGGAGGVGRGGTSITGRTRGGQGGMRAGARALTGADWGKKYAVRKAGGLGYGASRSSGT